MKHIKKFNEQDNSDNFSEENYQMAKKAFEAEEGRSPNMNNTRDANAVAMIEVGIRYARNNTK